MQHETSCVCSTAKTQYPSTTICHTEQFLTPNSFDSILKGYTVYSLESKIFMQDHFLGQGIHNFKVAGGWGPIR